MSATFSVVPDLLKNAKIDDDWSTGYSITRAFSCLITNDGGTAKAGYYELVMGATGIPVKGDAHPTDAALICYHKSASTVDGKNWIVLCDYARQIKQYVPNNTATPQFEFGSSLVEETTNEDVNGNPLAVGWIGSYKGVQYTTASTGAQGVITNDTQVATVQVLRPQRTISCTRLETTSPIVLQNTYCGYVNSGSMTINGQTFADGTVLCKGVPGRSTDGGLSYTNTYIFEIRAGGWNAKKIYFEIDGAPPSGVQSGNGIATYDFYPTVSMSGLSL